MATTKDLRETVEIDLVRSPKTDHNYLYRFFNNTTHTVPTDLTGYSFEWQLIKNSEVKKTIIPVITGNQFPIDIADTDPLFRNTNKYKYRIWVTFPDGVRKLWITGDYTLQYGEPDTQAGSTINVVISSQALTFNLSVVPYTIVQNTGGASLSADVVAALEGAENPAAGNVYITTLAIETIGDARYEQKPFGLTVSTDTPELTFNTHKTSAAPYTPTGNFAPTIAAEGNVDNTIIDFPLVMDGVKSIILPNDVAYLSGFGNNDNLTYTPQIAGTYKIYFRYLAGEIEAILSNPKFADTTGPTVIITSSETSPTNTTPIPATFTFNEDVTGFVVGDITVGNGTAGNFQSVSASVYTADITPTGQGAVTVDVDADVCIDAANNGNQAATQFSITFDSVGAVPTITSPQSSPTSTTPVVIDIDFDEVVTGFVIGDITVSGTANTSLQNFSGSGQNYQAEAVPANDGTILIDVAGGVCVDTAGNSNQAATQFSITFEAADVTAPTLQSATINAAGDTLTLVFDENVTSTGTGYSITGTTASINALVSGSGTDTLVFSLSGIAQQGEVYTIDYDSGTGDTADTATIPNDLVSFSGVAVTNNSTQGAAVFTSLVNTSQAGANLTKTGGTNGAFDAGAISVKQLPIGADGFAEWTLDTPLDDIMVTIAGLGDTNPGASYESIDYGVQVTATGVYRTWLSGTIGVTTAETAAAGHIVRIEKSAANGTDCTITMSYSANGTDYTQLQQLTAQTDRTLFFDCSIHRTNGEIKNLTLGGGNWV